MLPLRIAFKFTKPTDYDAVLMAGWENLRLPQKPGEAIFDDGNSPCFFRAPDVSSPETSTPLSPLLKRAKTAGENRGFRDYRAIALGGDDVADIGRNDQLMNTVTTGGQTEETVWLGETYSLSATASITLHRQSFSNLFVLCQGRQDAAARNMLAVCILTVLARKQSNHCFICVGNGFNLKNWPEMEILCQILPNRIATFDDGDTEAVSKLADKVKSSTSSVTKDTCIVIYPALNRLEFTRSEFQTLFQARTLPRGGAASAASSLNENLRTILTDGPQSGMHTIVIADSLAAFDRQAQLQFNLRVAFRVNSSDSNNFLDKPDAANLQDGFAFLLDRSESTELKKFRPYASVTHDWFESAARQVAARQSPEK